MRLYRLMSVAKDLSKPKYYKEMVVVDAVVEVVITTESELADVILKSQHFTYSSKC